MYSKAILHVPDSPSKIVFTKRQNKVYVLLELGRKEAITK